MLDWLASPWQWLLVVLGLFALAHYILTASSGIATNPIDAIAMPNFARAFGIGEILYPPLEMTVRRCVSLWWILSWR